MAGDVPTGVESRAHDIIVTCIVCSILSVIFIAIRLYTRYFINHSVGVDDYVAAVTLPFCIAYSVLIGLSTQHGMGLHQADFTPQLKEQWFLWIGIASEFYVLSLMGYKLAILLLYLRIYRVNIAFRWACYITMFCIFGYLFANLWTQFFGCDPPQKSWMSDLPGHCIDGIKADYAYGSLHWISDFAIFVLPIPMIWKTQLKTKEKIGIMIIFMFGSLNWAVATARFVFAVQDLTADDRTWLAARTFLWSVIEVNTGLICSCVPVLKPFYRAVVSETLADRSWSYTRSRKGTDKSSYPDNHTAGTSDTALNDLEHGKMKSQSGSEVEEGAGGARTGSSATHGTLKGHDYDDEKYGIDPNVAV